MANLTSSNTCEECGGRGYTVEGSTRDGWWQRYKCAFCNGEGVNESEDTHGDNDDNDDSDREDSERAAG